MYDLEFQPLARQDMINIVTYIDKTLHNRAAALRLAENMITEIENIGIFPYSGAVYHPLRALKYEYRKLLVGNYLILYRVDEKRKMITVARVVYAKSDYGKVLE